MTKSKKATEYEQKRLENIKRNEQLLASLNIKSKLSELVASVPLERWRGRPSFDVKIGVLTGANYDDQFMINHNDQICIWSSKFKGVWGWDDSHIFVGNTKRGVDIISAEERRLVTTLDSPHMTAVTSYFDAHPLKPGMLAGATGGGQVYVWST